MTFFLLYHQEYKILLPYGQQSIIIGTTKHHHEENKLTPSGQQSITLKATNRWIERINLEYRTNKRLLCKSEARLEFPSENGRY